MLKSSGEHIKNVSFSFFIAIIVAAGFFLFLVLNYNLLREYIPTLPNFSTQPTEKPKQHLFYGVSVEMGQMLPTSPQYVTNHNGEDLIDIAARLGVNMIRITNSAKSPSQNNANGTFSAQDWNVVLGKMKQKNIEAIVLIESPSIYQKDISLSYLPFVKKYVLDSYILSHDNIYAIDLYNEPVVSDRNIATLSAAAQIIKRVNPQIKLTVGWWAQQTPEKDDSGAQVYNWTNYSLGKKLDPFIDFYSVHLYGFDKSKLGIYPNPSIFTQNFLHAVASSLQTTKPILIEEFGAANGDALSDQKTIGSPEIQAKAYEGVYTAIVGMQSSQIIGSIAYQLNQKTDKPDAWAITKDNGNYFFPAAYILQKYALEITKP